VEEFFEVSFIRQFALAFILMSLAPIILIVFSIYYFDIHSIIETKIPYFRLTIILVVLLSLAGYDVIRRNMVAFYFFIKKAQDIIQKDHAQKIYVNSSGDVRKTVDIFNQILVKNKK